MFCPSCGAKNSTDQKFCRSCGMNLEQTAVSLLAQFPANEPAALQKQERMLERFGQIAFGGFGIVIVMAIVAFVYVILTKMVLTGDKFWSGLLLIAFIIFAGLGLSYVFIAEHLKEKRNKLNPNAAPRALEGKATAELLEEGSFQPARSVTENTTDLLLIENRTKKL